jgi:hypothetical protein
MVVMSYGCIFVWPSSVREIFVRQGLGVRVYVWPSSVREIFVRQGLGVRVYVWPSSVRG